MPFAVNSKFPAAIAQVADLFNQANYTQGETLPSLASGMLAGDSSFTVAAGTGANLPTDNFLVTIDTEIIFVTARSTDTCNTLIRGMEGTTPASHNAGVLVNAFVTAQQHNQIASDLNAIETQLYDLIQVNGTRVASGALGITSLLNGIDTQSEVLVGGSIIPVLPEQLYVNGSSVTRWPVTTLVDGSSAAGDVLVNGVVARRQSSPNLYYRPQAIKVLSTVLYNGTAYYGCLYTPYLQPGMLISIAGHPNAGYNKQNLRIIACGVQNGFSWFSVPIPLSNTGGQNVASGNVFAYVPALDIRALPNENINANIPFFVCSDYVGLNTIFSISSGTNSAGVTSSAQMIFGDALTSTINNLFRMPHGIGGATSAIFFGAQSSVSDQIAGGLSLQTSNIVEVANGFGSHTTSHRLQSGANGNQPAWDMAQFTGTLLAAPGAGFGRLEWLAGTTSGLKLVGFSGTSLVGSTIADNVGAGRNQTTACVAYADTAASGSINTTTIYAVPAAGAGEYRLSWNAKVTTPGSVSSTLGPLTVTYVDQDGVTQTITCVAQSSAGTMETSDTGNTTTTVLLGMPLLLNANSSTNITYALGYSSNAANTMVFNLHIRLESL